MELYGISLPAWVPDNVYLFAVLTIVSFWIISHVVILFMEKVVLSITKRTKTDVDTKIAKAITKPLSFIMLMIGFIIAMDVIINNQTAAGHVRMSFISIIILAVAFSLAKILSIIIESWGRTLAAKTKSDLDDQLILLLNKFQRVVVFILAVLMILQMWGVEIGPLLASLGIAGIAVAFALQTTLGNIFGGISLILDKAIRVGDVIKLADGTYGRVIEVGFRSTRVRTWSNELMIIPNGELANMRIQNYILPDEKCRVDVSFGVAYGTDVGEVESVAFKVLNNFSHILKDPKPECTFDEMADSSLNFTLRFWVPDFSYRYNTSLEVRKALYNALNDNEIDIPFPTRTVYLKEDDYQEPHKVKKNLQTKQKHKEKSRDERTSIMGEAGDE